MNARFWNTVGLCDEKLLNCSDIGVSAALPQNESWSWSMRYSPVMNGCAGSDTSIKRAQPHLQPNASKVKVPYTSSVVSASRRPSTGTAEWLLGQSFSCSVPVDVVTTLAQSLGETFGTAAGSNGFCSQTGRFFGSVSRLLLSNNTVPGATLFPAMSLVSRTR